jgi:hypothetical protein
LRFSGTACTHPAVQSAISVKPTPISPIRPIPAICPVLQSSSEGGSLSEARNPQSAIRNSTLKKLLT